MQKYKIVQELDPNEEYELEAENPTGAALEALTFLGWNLVCEDGEDEDTDEQA